MAFKNTPGCCSCECSFCVHVVDNNGDGVEGITVTISHSGTEVFSGETNSSGDVCWTEASSGVSYDVVVDNGECTYTTGGYCPWLLNLVSCVGTVTINATDGDTDDEIDGITLVPWCGIFADFNVIPELQDCEPDSTTLTDLTEPFNEFTYDGNVIRFCYLGVHTLPESMELNLQAEADGYYDTCVCVNLICDEDTTKDILMYSEETYFLNQCCYTCCAAQEGHNPITHKPNGNLIPKTLTLTFSGPDFVLGPWNGVPITVTYDGDFSGGRVHEWSSGCLEGGGYGECYNNRIANCDSYNFTCTEIEISRINVPEICEDVHWQSSIAKFTIVTGPGGAPDLNCGAGVSFKNFWGAGCPSPDPTPDCWIDLGLTECTSFFNCHGIPFERCHPANVKFFCAGFEPDAPEPCGFPPGWSCFYPTREAPMIVANNVDGCVPFAPTYTLWSDTCPNGSSYAVTVTITE